MVKTFIKNNKTTLFVIFISLAIFGGISFFSPPIAQPPIDLDDKKVIVPVAGQKLYELKEEFISPDYIDKKITYSLSFPANVIRETKFKGQETLFYYKGQRVAVLSFYYFPSKMSATQFATNILGQKYTLAIDTKEQKFGAVSYITASGEKSYYRIASFKDGEWIGMIEMLVGNDTLEKQLLDSLQIK